MGASVVLRHGSRGFETLYAPGFDYHGATVYPSNSVLFCIIVISISQIARGCVRITGPSHNISTMHAAFSHVCPKFGIKKIDIIGQCTELINKLLIC